MLSSDRVFITGGSGFIGTNLVQRFLDLGLPVINFDSHPPRNPSHSSIWQKGDLCDGERLRNAVLQFAPTVILHVAARTDLDGKSNDDYAANTAGVHKIIEAARAAHSLSRIIFFSSMLVCKIGYIPRDEHDYCPTTLYGKSKVDGELTVRSLGNDLPWVLVRPTSIWGPWFGPPYRNFFESIRGGWFVLPRKLRLLRSFGYVENLVAEVVALLEAPAETVLGRTFYLADYAPLDLATWANQISRGWGRGSVSQVPLTLLKIGAAIGDLASKCGFTGFPLSSFRLNNLLTPTIFDMRALREVCSDLPIGMPEGVEKTIAWLRTNSTTLPGEDPRSGT